MTVSYGRMGYAVTTSRSARARASATASLPEIRSSLSSSLLAARAAGVTTAMFSSSVCLSICSPRTAGPQPRDVLRLTLPLNRLVGRVLARDARGDLDAAVLEVLLELLLVLTAEPE